MAGGATRLRAGTAGVTITPDRPLYLEGYGGRSKPTTGTLDPLEARAIVFDDGERRAAIVSADLCGLDAPSVQRIRAAATAGIPGEDLIVTYSHTHAAPAVTRVGSVAIDADYLGWVEEALARVVVAASRSLRPVTLGTGEGQVDFNVNRRLRGPDGKVMRRISANPAGLVDKRVRVLRVDPADAPAPPGTLGGRPLPQTDPVAVLFSYVSHATVLSSDNNRYSGDYPGAARRFVERAYGADGQAGDGTQALFLPGCFGNVRPHLLRPDGSFRGATDHELTVLGRWLGSEVVQVAERIVAAPVASIAVGRREVQLPYARLPDAAELRTALEGPRRTWAQAMFDRLERQGRLPESETAEVHVLRLGRHWIAVTPGETTLEIGLAIERGLVELGLARPERGDLALAVGYANDYKGYLCSASVITEGGYEPNDWAGYLRPGPFAPEIEQALVTTALALAYELGPAPG